LAHASVITLNPAIRYQSKPANGLAEDVIVLPCRSVHMQGADFAVEVAPDIQDF
jgi:hypothetical protein